MNKKLLLLTLLGWLSFGLICAQTPIIQELKSKLENHVEDDSIKINLLIELSYQYQWLNFYSSLDYAERALKIAEKKKYNKGIAIALYRSAHCHWAFGDGNLAIQSGLKAYQLAEEYKMPKVLAESAQILARCYMDQRESEKAKNYINKAEKIGIQLKDWDLLSRVYNLAGVIQFLQMHDDSALLLYSKALEITEQHSTSKSQLSQIISNMAECYVENNPERSFEYFNKSLLSAKENNNRSAEAGILSSMGAAYLSKNRFREAERCMKASLALSQELGLKRVIRHVYYGLADLKTKEGDANQAFDYISKYHEINNSILDIAKARQIVELETQYETARKEQRIALLEQEKRIQTIWTKVLIGGSILLAIALFIIYRLQNLRTKKTKELLSTQHALNAKLKETDLLKSRFFANISHEFRTPLSLILAPLEEKLAKSVLSASERNSLELMQRNANRLLDLVNQLLDLAKLEAGKMELHIREDDLHSFINLLISSFDSLAESLEIDFRRNISLEENTGWFDADKLEKILSNVLLNAFKFTPTNGVIELSISSKEQELHINLSDTGKGISEEDKEHIFSPFYQSRHLVDNGQPGTGLGLSLVSELIKLHQGRINLQSLVNKGTTISIWLPIYKLEWAIVQENLTPALSQLITRQYGANTDDPTEEELDLFDTAHADCILIIEDNPDLRNFIASGFAHQFQILTASDGEEGLTKAIDQIPDLIISDVMMPKMDGIELTDRLKSDERTNHIPIILLTAKADGPSRMAGLKKGADDYLAKPFSSEELHVRAINLIEQRKKLAIHLKNSIAEPIKVNSEPTLDEKFIAKARQVIESHISDSKFGVEVLADEMNLSRAQLFRKMKALIDTSPSELINDIRLQKAAKMIRSKSDTLAQISYAVGFNEQSYFAKRFRKKFGMSPSNYAESLG